MLVTDEKARQQPAEGTATDIVEPNEPQDAEPPPYDGPSTSAAPQGAPMPSTSITTSSSGGGARSNYIQIITPHKAISESFHIDVSRPLLPLSGPSRSEPEDFSTHDGSRPNLFVSSDYRSVNATCEISRSSPLDGNLQRAFIVAQSEHGNVTVGITRRDPGTSVHICAKSNIGNIIIRLPKDFVGPIKCRSNSIICASPQFRITPKVKEKITMYSIDEAAREAYAFIGDPIQMLAESPSPVPATPISPTATIASTTVESTAPGFGYTKVRSLVPPSASNVSPREMPSGTEWAGDQIEIIATHGRVKICYALLEGEEKETDANELQTIVRHIKENGPIAALVKAIFRNVNKAVQNSKKEKEKEKETS
ncbi:SubName: Full=Uncharacterized protein {ECO:0000313/EMBL:CCA74802.1} [Serendipita indica DSM 11827]|nr:SubName: Full=Uncharacterized protein {ECO:0000313/EMBL:CCA74802.1} [Serendipita indica DSM 11827]